MLDETSRILLKSKERLRIVFRAPSLFGSAYDIEARVFSEAIIKQILIKKSFDTADMVSLSTSVRTALWGDDVKDLLANEVPSERVWRRVQRILTVVLEEVVEHANVSPPENRSPHPEWLRKATLSACFWSINNPIECYDVLQRESLSLSLFDFWEELMQTPKKGITNSLYVVACVAAGGAGNLRLSEQLLNKGVKAFWRISDKGHRDRMIIRLTDIVENWEVV